MKKITSLLLTVVLLATMIPFTAIPAFAAGKEKVKVPSEVHLHYTGEELTAFEDTDKYTVFDGKRTNTGSYYAILTLRNPDKYEWESTNSSNSSEVRVSFEIHKYRDNGNGYCRECGGTDHFTSYVSYLEKKVNSDNSVTSKEKILNIARLITKEDSVWGSNGTISWYVVNESVELENRPVVKGDVRIILTNETTLTANKGITVDESGSISFYAQTDDEETMGKLTADTGDVTAIGGRNGENGDDNYINRAGNAAGGGNVNVYFYGGKNTLKSSGVASVSGGNGGNGGNIIIENIEGNIERSLLFGNGANGGTGGNVNVYFYGGKNTLESSGAASVSGGNGGNGGNGGRQGDPGTSGKITKWVVSGTPVIKAGASAESAELINNISEYKYTNEPYLSVQYESVSAIGSVLSNGNLWIIGGVAVLALGGVVALVIVKKKKKVKNNS